MSLCVLYFPSGASGQCGKPINVCVCVCVCTLYCDINALDPLRSCYRGNLKKVCVCVCVLQFRSDARIQRGNLNNVCVCTYVCVCVCERVFLYCTLVLVPSYLLRIYRGHINQLRPLYITCVSVILSSGQWVSCYLVTFRETPMFALATLPAIRWWSTALQPGSVTGLTF